MNLRPCSDGDGHLGWTAEALSEDQPLHFFPDVVQTQPHTLCRTEISPIPHVCNKIFPRRWILQRRSDAVAFVFQLSVSSSDSFCDCHHANCSRQKWIFQSGAAVCS